MKRLILLMCIFVSSIFNAQLAGKKVKTPFTAIDGHTYKVGDVIQVGYPTKGETYQKVFYYKFESTLESISKVLDAVSGKGGESSKVYYALKGIKEFQGEIIYFRVNDYGTFAIVEHKSGHHIAILLDEALPIREMISNNPEYKDKLLANTTADFTDNSTKIKSFSPNFDVKLISAEGDINNQTVALTFLISHKLVHQEVCINSEKNNRLFDFNGNEYSVKTVRVGNNTNLEFKEGLLSGLSVCNKIPTNVPVKVIVSYKQILPSVRDFSFTDIRVLYKAFDGYESYNTGNIEVNNIKVDWK